MIRLLIKIKRLFWIFKRIFLSLMQKRKYIDFREIKNIDIVKLSFEKDIINLLKDYRLYKDEFPLQYIEIIYNLDNYPKIKLEYKVISKED